MTSTMERTGQADAAPHTATRRLPFGAVAGAVGLVVVAAPAVAGPVVVLALALLAAAAVAAVLLPTVALALPLLVAPVALREIPGGQGLQVVHLVVLAATGAVAVGVARGTIRALPPLTVAAPVVFVAAVLLASVASIDPFRSIKSSINHVLGLALCVAAATVARAGHDRLELVLRLWVASSLVVILPNLPAAATADVQFAGALIENRAQGVFAQPNDFGEFTLFCIGAAWALAVAGGTRWDRALGIAGVLAGASGLAVSFSRGSWVGAVALVAAACLLAPRLAKGPVIFGLAAALTVAVGAIAALPPFPAIVQRLASLIGASANPEDDRPIIHAQAWRLFGEHPVLGQGPATFPLGAQDAESLLIRRPYIHAHAVPLNVAAEMGFVGLVALLLLAVLTAGAVLLALRRLRRQPERRPEAATLAVLGALMFGIAVHGLIDVVYTNPYLIPLAWMLLGLTLGAAARALDPIPQSHLGLARRAS
jgi:O-antigen ligase